MLIDASQMPLVAMEFMNNTHKKDVEIINDLHSLLLAYEEASNAENEKLFNEKYTDWVIHTVEHFATEEKKMLEMNFPPYPMHKGEHDNALQKMETIFRQWQKSKNINIPKTYIAQEVPQWFTHHIQTMDTVTAMFFQTGQSPCSIR